MTANTYKYMLLSDPPEKKLLLIEIVLRHNYE
jgi:hypothetical protein